eukprot:176148-Hanusia_phi.AAC.3
MQHAFLKSSQRLLQGGEVTSHQDSTYLFTEPVQTYSQLKYFNAIILTKHQMSWLMAGAG